MQNQENVNLVPEIIGEIDKFLSKEETCSLQLVPRLRNTIS